MRVDYSHENGQDEQEANHVGANEEHFGGYKAHNGQQEEVESNVHRWKPHFFTLFVVAQLFVAVIPLVLLATSVDVEVDIRVQEGIFDSFPPFSGADRLIAEEPGAAGSNQHVEQEENEADEFQKPPGHKEGQFGQGKDSRSSDTTLVVGFTIGPLQVPEEKFTDGTFGFLGKKFSRDSELNACSSQGAVVSISNFDQLIIDCFFVISVAFKQVRDRFLIIIESENAEAVRAGAVQLEEKDGLVNSDQVASAFVLWGELSPCLVDQDEVSWRVLR